MVETLRKIETLLKKEKWQLDYDYYIVENTLYLSLKSDIKKNSLYHYDYLYHDETDLKTEIEPYSSWEYEMFKKYKDKNNLWSCVEIGGKQYDQHKEFRVEVYNNIYENFTTAKNIHNGEDDHYIKNDSYLVEFVELYVIPGMHSIEKCTELLEENYHFTNRITKENFSEKFLMKARKKKIENII